MVDIPQRLETAVEARLGTDGRAWLDGLPGLVATCERRWSVRVGPPFDPGGICGWVAPAVGAGGTTAVLKISLLERENAHEAVALRHYDGRGAVRLLEADEAMGAMLLERAEPGHALEDVAREDEAVEVMAAVGAQLWRPAGEAAPFAQVADRAIEWAADNPGEFAALGAPFEPALLAEAVTCFRDLAGSQREHVVVHGDFHRGNVLAAQREPWLVIDPKPLVGERAYDVGYALLRDWPGTHRDETALVRRLDRFAALLGLDPDRIRRWALALGIELGLWSLSVGSRDDFEGDLACARLLAGMASGAGR